MLYFQKTLIHLEMTHKIATELDCQGMTVCVQMPWEEMVRVERLLKWIDSPTPDMPAEVIRYIEKV